MVIYLQEYGGQALNQIEPFAFILLFLLIFGSIFLAINGFIYLYKLFTKF